MYYDHHVLNKLSKTSRYEYDMGILGPRMQSAVINALSNGGLIFANSGLAATTLNMLSDAYDLPLMSMSIRTRWYSNLSLKRIPADCIEELTNWSKVDRVTYRMEDPEGWEKKPHWKKEEPSFEFLTNRNHIGHIYSFSKNAKMHKELLTAATRVYANTEEYKAKVAPIIETVKQKKCLTFIYRDNKIVGAE